MMILTFNHNYSVRNEFRGSNLCRKVISHMTLRVLIKSTSYFRYELPLRRTIELYKRYMTLTAIFNYDLDL